MLYREVEVEKYWDISSAVANKKERITSAILTEKYGASIKKDGEYIRVIYDTDGEVWILGRGTNAKTVKNLNNHLVFLSDWVKKHFGRGTCFLGELYVPGKTSRAIRAYTGSLVPKSLANQKACPPKYYIFDAWAINGVDMMCVPYVDRMSIIRDTIRNLNGSGKHPQIEYATLVSGSENIFNFMAEAFANDEEGIVLVDLNSLPAPGKRTAWKSIKVKKEFKNSLDCFFNGESSPPTREYTGKEIEGWKYWEDIRTGEKVFGEYYNDYLSGRTIEPITKPYYMGWPGSLGVAVWKGRQAIRLCYVSGLTDELKEQFVKEKEKIIFRPISIMGMETTEDHSIRHPKFLGFRDDIPLDDCTWDKIFGGE